MLFRSKLVLISGIVGFAVAVPGVGLLQIGAPLVLLAAAGLSVRAASRSRRGAWHRYPFTVRLIS